MIKRLFIHFKQIYIQVIRFLALLFRGGKKIELIHFEYYKYWHFTDANLAIDFNFKHAIWYKVGGIKVFDLNKPITIRLNNFSSPVIHFVVYGFFQKKSYEIHLNRVAKFNLQNIKLDIHKIKFLKIYKQDFDNSILKCSKFKVNIKNFKITTGNIKTNKRNFRINYTTFNTQDYL